MMVFNFWLVDSLLSILIVSEISICVGVGGLAGQWVRRVHYPLPLPLPPLPPLPLYWLLFPLPLPPWPWYPPLPLPLLYPLWWVVSYMAWISC